jgi:formate--tetrahydrofolate ligase
VFESDIEIARSAQKIPIADVAKKLDISYDDIVPYGHDKAKISDKFLKKLSSSKKGKLILVTAINPTPAGEGKTTTTVGLGDGLNAIGKKTAICIREASLGPCFGMKGGAAGGGKAQVVPMEEMNLHFTGDFHAITSAHNLLSARSDNHIYWGNKEQIDIRRVVWKRVLDMNDRALRDIVTSLGGAPNGFPRQAGFDITVASEVMAILCLANDLKDLQQRLGNIIIAYRRDKSPVFCKDIKADGAMTVLLQQAMQPNIVQTLENNPALVHGGPFANIAHGCNSVIATKAALNLADYVVTEAGFGADMGAEKALHIKSLASGKTPDCVVINVTVRSMKLHGGGFSTGGGKRPPKEELESENVDATRKGAGSNLRRHVRNISMTGLPVIVSINKFSTDTDAEIQAISDEAKLAGAKDVVIFEGHAGGGLGAGELADAVVNACEKHDESGRQYSPIVESGMSARETILKIATNVYGAHNVDFSPEALRSFETLKKWDLDKLPVCMAKTQYSFSHEASELGAPTGFTLPIREIRINAGAGFLVAICGSMMTMPGLPKTPIRLPSSSMSMSIAAGLFGNP